MLIKIFPKPEVAQVKKAYNLQIALKAAINLPAHHCWQACLSLDSRPPHGRARSGQAEKGAQVPWGQGSYWNPGA